jgi:hypothetical protein
MQKKAIQSLLSKNVAANNKLFMVVPKASFHASKGANVEVSFSCFKTVFLKQIRILINHTKIVDDCERCY